MSRPLLGSRRMAWCCKCYPKYSDALALVRKELWAQEEPFSAGQGGKPTRQESHGSLWNN